MRSAVSLLVCLLWLSVCPADAWSQSTASQAYPADPFADDYHVPVAKEVGTAAGQLRFLGAVGFGGKDTVFLQSSYEHMTFSYLGLRVSGHLAARHPRGEPGFWSFKTGPTVHFLPYRRFDISVFIVGGVSRVSIDDDSKTWMPEISPGLTLDLHLHSYWMVRLEGQYVWGIYRDDGMSASRNQWVGFLGAGFLL